VIGLTLGFLFFGLTCIYCFWLISQVEELPKPDPQTFYIRPGGPAWDEHENFLDVSFLSKLCAVGSGVWIIARYNYLKDFEGLRAKSVFYAVFNFRMFVVVASEGAFSFIIRWEIIGLCSVVLVSTHNRRAMALFSAGQAWLQN